MWESPPLLILMPKEAVQKTGNKPGVTKGKQWIRLNKSLELLDTPGITWPKFEDQSIGMKLAFIGSINDEILFQKSLPQILFNLLQTDIQRQSEKNTDMKNPIQTAMKSLHKNSREPQLSAKGWKAGYEKSIRNSD